jgi:pilus assembly protein Flp/PilA
MIIIWCRKGATAIEYALVASLISIAALAAFQMLGDRIDLMYGNVSNKM